MNKYRFSPIVLNMGCSSKKSFNPYTLILILSILQCFFPPQNVLDHIFALWWSSKSMTSKPDNPPPYEDALHHPKYDNCPPQSQPPPPSYTAIPGTFPSPPGYWGQAGPWTGSAFSPSGVTATVPTLSAGVPAANTDREEEAPRLDLCTMKSHV